MTSRIEGSSVGKERILMQRLADTLEIDEGRVPYVYGDADPKPTHLKTRIKSPAHARQLEYGNPTWGIGEKLVAGRDDWMYSDTDAADDVINTRRDASIKERIRLARKVALESKTPFDFDELPLNQQEAMVNLVFNVGDGELATWNKTLGYMAANNFEEAGKEILRGRTPDSESKYLRDVKDRAIRVSEKMKSNLPSVEVKSMDELLAML